MLHMPTPMLFFEGFIAPPGQVLFTSSATWTVPDGITSICAVVISPGGAAQTLGEFGTWGSGAGGTTAYLNDIPVASGETLNLTISANPNAINGIDRSGSYLLSVRAPSREAFGSVDVGTGFRGGSGSTGSSASRTGGGAGGYTSVGGPGGMGGSNGGGGTSPLNGGGGAAPGGSSSGLNGAAYGGGAGLSPSSGTPKGNPGPGCVRIIWGPDRNFPSKSGDV